MTLADLLREIVESLSAHRLRAGLAATGIVAGVAAIVAALAIAGGARAQALTEIGALGTQNVLIRSVVRSDAKGGRLAPVLTAADAVTLQLGFPFATSAAVRLTHDSVSGGSRVVPAPVAGVTPSWLIVYGLTVGRGRWLNTREDEHAAVLGETVARAAFGPVDPIGQLVRAAGEWRTVVGILAGGHEAGRSSLQLLSVDDTVFVPFTALDAPLGTNDSGKTASEIVLRLPDGDDPGLAGEAVARLLGGLRTAEPGFDVLVPRELLQARLRSARNANMLLVAVGLIALVISGVGIMNIMVASVSERASEIGVRRALGARRQAVLLQFAGEALALGLVAGTFGIPVGAAAAWAAARLAGWPVALSAGALAGALALAVAVALAAGAYPARLAANLSPIDALRQ